MVTFIQSSSVSSVDLTKKFTIVILLWNIFGLETKQLKSSSMETNEPEKKTPAQQH
jgi:hypothetical protein